VKPSEVLDAAADLIEEKGWWDGTGTWTDDGAFGHCAVTALAETEPDTYEFSDAHNRACSLLTSRVGFNIPKWNDAHDADTVIETLRKLAAEARWTE
jgi:hypothetical protein